jgi:hypothetical protein
MLLRDGWVGQVKILSFENHVWSLNSTTPNFTPFTISTSLSVLFLPSISFFLQMYPNDDTIWVTYFYKAGTTQTLPRSLSLPLHWSRSGAFVWHFKRVSNVQSWSSTLTGIPMAVRQCWWNIACQIQSDVCRLKLISVPLCSTKQSVDESLHTSYPPGFSFSKWIICYRRQHAYLTISSQPYRSRETK